MEREDFETIRFDEHATLMWRRAREKAEAVAHFARLRDALSFADHLDHAERETAWIVLDKGLLAPEDLPALVRRAPEFAHA